MNHCEKYEELCSAALDHMLTAQEKEELDAHLTVCPSCRAYLEDLQEMRALWKELEVPVPNELHEKMMGAIEAEIAKTIVQTPQRTRGRPPVFTMLAAAAACVMLAVSGQLTGLFGQVTSVPIQNKMPNPAPSTAEVTVPPVTEPKPVQTEQKPEQPEVQKPKPDTQIIAPQSEPPKPKEERPVEKQPEQKQTEQKKPEQKKPEQDVPQTASVDNMPQTVSEEPMVAVAEAPDQPLPGKMGRTAEPQTAATYAISSGLPEELQQMQFARCYDVTGGTELPVLDDMTLLVTADSISYYSVENNESKIVQVQQELEKSRYTLTLNETSGVSIQRSAKIILLIVHAA